MSFQSRIEAAVPVRLGGPAYPLPLIILAATALAAVLRFWGIGTRSLWLDEAYSGWFSALSWAELWLETPRYEPHPPLYYSILKLWRLIGGGEAGGLRALSALAGIATVPVVALAAHRLARLLAVRRRLVLTGVAAALALLSPRLHVVAQDARPYALLTLAYAIGIYGWLRLATAFRDGGDGRWSDWAILGTGTAFVLWLHGIGILYAAALLGALVLTALAGRGSRRWQRLAVTVTLVVALYLPCLVMLAGRSGDWSGGWLQWDAAGFPGALLQLYGLHRWDEAATPVLALVAIPSLLFVALRALARSGRDAVAWSLGLLLLAPPLAAALISALGTPVFIPRTQVAVLVPAYLLVAYAIAMLPRRQAVAGAVLVGLLFLVNLGQALVRPDLEPWREIAAILEREMRPGDVIWVYPNDVKIPLERALGSGADIVPIPAAYPAMDAPGTHPSGSPAVVAIDAPHARAWAARHAPPPGATIWLLRGGPSFFDPDGSVLAELGRGRRHGSPRQWLDMELRPLRPR
jgi:mannosyltransferase